MEASIALYRKLRFKEIPLKNNAYERCDILMELCLENKTATIIVDNQHWLAAAQAAVEE